MMALARPSSLSITQISETDGVVVLLTLPAMGALGANAEDIVVPHLIPKACAFGVVGHTGELSPEPLVIFSPSSL